MEEAVQFEGINGSWAVICHSTWKRVPCREPSVPNARAMDGDMHFQSWATFLLGPWAAYGNTGKPHWNSQGESGWKLWVLSVKGLIRVGNLGQVTAQQCWEKLGDLFCCEFYLKTESGQTLQPKEVQEEGTLWMPSVALACTQLTELTESGYPHSVTALTWPWEPFVPNIGSIRGGEPIEREGTCLPMQCDRSQVGQRWPQVITWLQPAWCGSSCFGKGHNKVSAPSALFGECALLLCPSQGPVTFGVVVALHFSSRNEWLAFMSRSCLSTDWLNLIIVISSNRSKALI